MQGRPAERRESWFGYQQNTEATKRFLSTLPNPTIRRAGPLLFQGPPSPFGVQDKEPIVLTRALNKAWKARFGTDFVVGRQEIGDCVSWGWGHAADIHLAILWAQGESDFFETNCTEALYGGGRCEALGKDNGGTQDGSYGAAQAKWFIEFGCVWRTKYSFVDTTTYSGSRAKDWGQWGWWWKE